jgi:hypothetical protein
VTIGYRNKGRSFLIFAKRALYMSEEDEF